ncbi:hypothetical protein RIF29_21909 [Crotalaria pallida]|uniref:Uncharacterized protein n=1 Tax=Crotalaria pallida TaxID=3830 RepID=A0AAN9F3G0_CROPI
MVVMFFSWRQHGCEIEIGILDHGVQADGVMVFNLGCGALLMPMVMVTFLKNGRERERERGGVKARSKERCGLLEEENRRLRDGFAKGVRPEEDDLVSLQLEALLAEKSRLASENANLVRENQCLNQLVEYHQLASQDLSKSYEHVIQGMCLDFTSPPPPTHTIAQEDDVDDDDDLKTREPQTILLPRTDLSTSLDECCHGEEQE